MWRSDQFEFETPDIVVVHKCQNFFQGYVFFYVCVCRSLTNGFKEWNKKAAHIFEYRGFYSFIYHFNIIENAVKLGHNKLGYNENSVKTKQDFKSNWPF